MAIGTILAAGALGLGIWGGSKKKPKAPPMPSLTESGKWAQGELYKYITSGIEGRGLIPDERMGFDRIRGAYERAYKQARPEFETQLGRAVPRGDVKVRTYARGALSRGYQGLQRALREQELMAPFQQQEQATQMGFEALAGEKKMGLSLANLANENLLQMANMPTFAGQLGYGLGRAGGWMSGAQRYAQGMAGGTK